MSRRQSDLSQLFRRLVFSTILLSALFLAVAPNSLADEARIPGYILKQRHELIGDTVTIMCKEGLKLTVTKSGETLLCKPPLWDASLYSLKSRKLYEKDFEHFQIPFTKALFVLGGNFMSTIPLAFIKQTADDGVKINCFQSTPEFAVIQKRKRANQEIQPSSPTQIDYAVAVDPSLNQDRHVGKILCKFFDLPSTSGIPLWFNYNDCQNVHHSYLEKVSFRKATFSASEFALPKGLKPINGPEQVLTGSDDTEAVEMMMMGVTKTEPKKPKKR